MNEQQIIEKLLPPGRKGSAELLLGIGDDCAVIKKSASQSWLVTMDTLLEGIHFDLQWHPPELLGKKTVAVNVSDIAAMGGRPTFAFLSLALPADFKSSFVSALSRGIRTACNEYGCILAGGDTVRSQRDVMLTMTLVGEVPADRVVTRSGGVPGDRVWVSGTLGMAAAGLELCRRCTPLDSDDFTRMVTAHLDPAPRTMLGRRLAESGCIKTMMDISDGLAIDLTRMCASSSCGARLHAERLPEPPGIREAATLVNSDPLQLMISGGEDYELLFTAPDEAAVTIQEVAAGCGVKVVEVGVLTEGEGVTLARPAENGKSVEEIDISHAGFDHFAGTGKHE